MIISRVIVGALTDLVVDEQKYKDATGFSVDTISGYKFDGADWIDLDTSATADFTTLGITYTGTPVQDDEIIVAYHPSEMLLFSAGKGVNCVKLNTNFDQVMSDTNDNETQINDIATNALQNDGSNLTQTIIDEFQQQTPNVLSTSGTISLSDNTANFLTLTGNGVIDLPAITPDQYSHTISLVVGGSAYTLDIGTATGNKHLYNPLAIDTTQTYNVLFVYNKIDSSWYYSLTQ